MVVGRSAEPLSDRYRALALSAVRSEPADRSEVERESVEVGLVRLGVLDMDEDASSMRVSVCEYKGRGAKLPLCESSGAFEKRSEQPIESDGPPPPA